jgi:hypothetical protein
MTEQQWTEWLSAEGEKLVAEYLLRPARLISDSRQERAITADYSGRELLEMLQNAADAAALSKTEADVLFVETADGLLIANRGSRFTADGVLSLMIAHLSPKLDESEVQQIGQKGLGFRSLLNWTDTPLITSGEMRIVFSPEHAADVFSQLISKENATELREAVGKAQSHGRTLSPPRLAFPLFGPREKMVARLSTTTLRVLETAEALRARGYDTVVGAPWRDPAARSAAVAQLRELAPECLLFVPSLGALGVQSEQFGHWHWARTIKGDRCVLATRGGEKRTWRLFRRSASKTSAVSSPSPPAPSLSSPAAELIIAVPEKGSLPPGRLFVHFPTEIPFPYPVLAHTPLELEQNRKHAVNNTANAALLRELAGFLPSCASVWQKSRPAQPFAGLRLAARQGDMPPWFEAAAWTRSLLEALRHESLVPTLANVHRPVRDARRLPDASDSWLPVPPFGHVARDTDEPAVRALLDAMGRACMSAAEFQTLIPDADF